MLIVLPGKRILEVGFSATLTRMSWPEEMPPSIQPVKHWFTKSSRNIFRHYINTRTNGITLLAQGIHIIFEFLYTCDVRTEERIVVHFMPVLQFNFNRPQLCQITANDE